MRLVGIVVVGAFALAVLGCGGGETVIRNGEPDAKTLAAEAGPGESASAPALGITVVGTGSAKAVPDVAEWSFGVRSEAESAEAAMRENGVATSRVIAALKAAGIARRDLRTEQISLYPQTDEYGHSVNGYSASNTVHATIRNVDRAGTVIDAAVRAGANEIYGPNLLVSESDEQYAQAVDSAYDDARRRAEAVAAKAGVVLGRPIAIVEGGGGGDVVYGEAYRTAADLAVPIEPGTQQIQATLTVTFEIST
jgi:uncharacterized protein YggE